MTCDCAGGGRTPRLERVEVVANDRVAEGIGSLVLAAPRIAESIEPGQFVHLKVAEESAHILRRPFSVHRVVGERIEILYQVLGAGTRILSRTVPGTRLDAIGPVGRGWSVPAGAAHALVVAGGLGAAPFGMLVERLARAGVAVVVAQGAPTASRLVAADLFRDMARTYEVATDDGSEGETGFVTVLTRRLLAEERFDMVYVCGPEPMQRAVAAQVDEYGIPCEVSLERLMACGIGACLSCVVTTTEGLKRACVEGPVFDAHAVAWNSAERPVHGVGSTGGGEAS